MPKQRESFFRCRVTEDAFYNPVIQRVLSKQLESKNRIQTPFKLGWPLYVLRHVDALAQASSSFHSGDARFFDVYREDSSFVADLLLQLTKYYKKEKDLPEKILDLHGEWFNSDSNVVLYGDYSLSPLEWKQVLVAAPGLAQDEKTISVAVDRLKKRIAQYESKWEAHIKALENLQGEKTAIQVIDFLLT